MAEKVEIIITAKDQATRELNKMQASFGKLKTFAAGALTAGVAVAAAGATAAIVGMGKGLQFAMDEAMEAQAGLAQLDAVLESTGSASGMTRDGLIYLADELSKYTTFTDDAIISSESLLLTFTNIGQDVFPEATKAILDMSTAFDQDLKSSTIQLGKALNDPVAGIGALSRIGVQFTEDQKVMIENLMASGDLIAAQNIILTEVQKQVSGSAVAAGNTFAGQMEIMKNRFANVAEGVGTALLPKITEIVTKLGDVLMPKIEEFGAKLATFIESEEFQQWLEDTSNWITRPDGLSASLDALGKGFSNFAAFFKSDDWNNIKIAVGFVGDALNVLLEIIKNLYVASLLWIVPMTVGLAKGEGLMGLEKSPMLPDWFKAMMTGSTNPLLAPGAPGGSVYPGLPGSTPWNNLPSSPAYNLTIITNAPAESLMNDFGMMQAWGGTP